MGPHLAAAGIRLISIDFPGARHGLVPTHVHTAHHTNAHSSLSFPSHPGHGMSTHRSPDAVYHFTDYVRE